VPVLVKVSYFPNWHVEGADGPYRVTPNLMVVVPTDTHVRMHYGYTGVDYLAYGLTAIGIVLVVMLFRLRPEWPLRPVEPGADTTGPDDPFGPEHGPVAPPDPDTMWSGAPPPEPDWRAPPAADPTSAPDTSPPRW
jgi:hypothetical protein